MKIANGPINCKSCGAPVTDDVCPYCGNLTGIKPWDTEAEYPIMECKECFLNFWNAVFPAIFCGMFGWAGIIMLVQMISEGEVMIAMFSIPFISIGVAGGVIVIRSVTRHWKVRTRGEYITAKVFGYTNDDVLINGSPAQVVKLLVETKDGPRILLYQLGNTSRPYSMNSELKLLVYENLFIIDNKTRYNDWSFR